MLLHLPVYEGVRGKTRTVRTYRRSDSESVKLMPGLLQRVRFAAARTAVPA